MAAARWGAATAVVFAMLFAGCEEQGASDGSGAAPAGGGTGGSGGTSSSPAGSAPSGGSNSGGGGGGSSFTLRPKSLAGKVDMAGIADCVKAFQVNMDRYPTNDEGLAVLVSSDRLERDKDKWQGPYVDSIDLLVDTYGNPLEYQNTGGGFILRSLGADGQHGGSGSSADIELRQ